MKGIVESMELVLRAALRAALSAWKTTPTATLHRESGIPPVAVPLRDARSRMPFGCKPGPPTTLHAPPPQLHHGSSRAPAATSEPASKGPGTRSPETWWPGGRLSRGTNGGTQQPPRNTKRLRSPSSRNPERLSSRDGSSTT
ncbi:hypothetical protein B0T16DRAFT_169228 [Cercophora newfieldiana]|uniref:Uncharacterized protein n=1 Tax=Cercophora newfieldiana TaxID=92897 RepID=A0AA40CQC1_9PEZI|nr:hypothetical protein B0T16DRAFT_169228 [Cercophora newfieldiana]